ncbi:uncharacterized protein LOC117571679 [Drosophila albomicans]|uniref:Uncharacterized protein LOC117571679 n=1 Tax=Drosophila albomicans TaxID=7291 RepID=A0A6P8X134_DROAB|nr:uncharacterized protein LOC117571679 [Drosophila albomicans]
MWIILLVMFYCCCGCLAGSVNDYKLVIDDPDVFMPCKEAPPDALDVTGLFNMDELEFALDGENIHIEGNTTLVWDIEPEDRVAVSGRLLHFERGNWEPTIFSIASNDFCSIMYDKDQYWYQYWTRYVINTEVHSKCVTHKGTVMQHEPFDLNMTFTNVRATLDGNYKFVLTLEAFDDKKVKRPTSICLEIKGDMEKL